MAFLGIQLPHEIARQLARIKVPGTPESSSTFHITMFYMGDEVPMEEVSKAALAAFDVVSATKPVKCVCKGLDTFPGEETVPVICPVDSPDLMKLREAMKKAFDKAGVEYSKKFPDFHPHVTLSYCDAKERPKSKDFETPVEWTSAEVVIWAGDSYDDRMIVTIPMNSEAKLASRVVLRHRLASLSSRPVG